MDSSEAGSSSMIRCLNVCGDILVVISVSGIK